jgi:hypothetical protein
VGGCRRVGVAPVPVLRSATRSRRSVTLFTGCGTDDDTNRYWCASGSAVWNNSGDTVFLRDGKGNIVVSLSYGDSG